MKIIRDSIALGAALLGTLAGAYSLLPTTHHTPSSHTPPATPTFPTLTLDQLITQQNLPTTIHFGELHTRITSSTKPVILLVTDKNAPATETLHPLAATHFAAYMQAFTEQAHFFIYDAREDPTYQYTAGTITLPARAILGTELLRERIQHVPAIALYTFHDIFNNTQKPTPKLIDVLTFTKQSATRVNEHISRNITHWIRPLLITGTPSSATHHYLWYHGNNELTQIHDFYFKKNNDASNIIK